MLSVSCPAASTAAKGGPGELEFGHKNELAGTVHIHPGGNPLRDLKRYPDHNFHGLSDWLYSKYLHIVGSRFPPLPVVQRRAHRRQTQDPRLKRGHYSLPDFDSRCSPSSRALCLAKLHQIESHWASVTLMVWQHRHPLLRHFSHVRVKWLSRVVYHSRG
jgi:hypothetical protein